MVAGSAKCLAYKHGFEYWAPIWESNRSASEVEQEIFWGMLATQCSQFVNSYLKK